ncbi:MAG: hypothetical protein POELPBGB_02871 [Bacteroidia bacterium]|nr:hypothetical protein [Bacteroidia bacterium]
MKKQVLIFTLLFFIFANNEKLYSQSGDLCADIKQVQSAAAGNFESIKGSLRSETGETFKTTTHNTSKCLYRAQDCYIQNVFGESYYAIMSEHDTYEDAEKAYDFQLTILKLCFLTDKKIVELKPDGNTLKSTAFLPTHLFGYYLYGDYFDIYKNEAGKYVVRMNINTVKSSNKIHYIYNGSLFNNFGLDMIKIMNSAPNNFKEVLGEKQEINGFMGTSYKYTVNANLEGISNLSYSEARLALANELTGIFYEGSDKAEAKKMFDKLSEKTKNTLSIDINEKYVYRIYESIEGDAIQHIFANEKEIFNDKTALVIADYSYDKYNKKYFVKLKFTYKGIASLF